MAGAPANNVGSEDYDPKCLLLQYDDRLPSPPHSKLRQLNKEYAKLHNYDYKLVHKWKDPEIPPYWAKIFVIQELLPSYDYLMYLDTDAVVHNINAEITELFARGKEFVFSADNPAWPAPFCAGVILIQKTDKTLKLLEDWLTYFDKENWVRNPNAMRWDSIDEITGTGSYAGEHYEQGSFIKYILPSREYRPILQRVSYTVLQGGLKVIPPHDDSFTLHFAGNFKGKIAHYLRSRGKRRGTAKGDTT